jgi:hypothetical protein
MNESPFASLLLGGFGFLGANENFFLNVAGDFCLTGARKSERELSSPVVRRDRIAELFRQRPPERRAGLKSNPT